jgi:hypothetical protein
VNDKVGIGYDPDRLFALQCECLRAKPYEVCGTCGEAPHDGPCNVLDVIRNDMHTAPQVGLN